MEEHSCIYKNSIFDDLYPDTSSYMEAQKPDRICTWNSNIAMSKPHCYSRGWQDCETGVAALLAVDNSGAGLNYSKCKTILLSK
jgi:hypothetical protein